MALRVVKFGGTSVGSPDRIRAVARQIARIRSRGDQLVAVVSAMGHTTDELLALAHQVSENPPHRELDMLLTAGERISMALLSMALAEEGVPASSFTGSQSGIITTMSHRRARIQRILGDRVRQCVADGRVAIVAGFQGVSETKEITTLGRGGSDTTAVALAAALGSELCEIYTDVDGVYTADPRIVPTARRIGSLSYDVMIEMAYRGAGVLHPRSVELARKYGVTVKVLNSLKGDPEMEGGTVVSKSVTLMEGPKVIGVTADQDKAWLRIQLARSTVLGSVFDGVSKAALLFVGPVVDSGVVWGFFEKDAQGDWKRVLDGLMKDGFVSEYRMDETQVPVSVIGEGLMQDGTVLLKTSEKLAALGIPVTMGTATPFSVTFAVPDTRCDEAVRELHELFLKNESGG